MTSLRLSVTLKQKSEAKAKSSADQGSLKPVWNGPRGAWGSKLAVAGGVRKGTSPPPCRGGRESWKEITEMQMPFRQVAMGRGFWNAVDGAWK